jgi:BirA family biotin operon repressor/biotin-[acetyl-CoA-carboxylase] ligase
LAVLTGKRCGLDATAGTLFAALDSVLAELGNGAALVERWRSSLDTLGRLVTVHQRDGVLEGTAEDVDDAGRLLLRTDDGRLHTLSEGDVTLRA